MYVPNEDITDRGVTNPTKTLKLQDVFSLAGFQINTMYSRKQYYWCYMI